MTTPSRDLDALAPLHVVVPLRSLSGGKARLGGALDAEEREELVMGMLRHTLGILRGWPACEAIHLVSPDALVLSTALDDAADPAGAESAAPPIRAHRQLEGGLNEAIDLAASAAGEEGATSLLVVPGDLPNLSAEALDRMLLAADAALAASRGGDLVVVAPSDARNGTNALLLKPVDVIAPRFGLESFEAHLRAAAAADAAVQVVSDPALGFDLDTPEDLDLLDPARLRELMSMGQEKVGWTGP